MRGNPINQHFTFCSFTVLNKLKPLKLSKVGLSTIKRQHSKNLTWWTEATETKKTWKMQIICKFVNKRCSKCSPFTWTHAWRCFLHWSTAVWITSGQKSDHRPTMLNCKALSLLRTVNEQKEKNVDIMHIVNPCTYFMTYDKYLLDRW